MEQVIRMIETEVKYPFVFNNDIVIEHKDEIINYILNHLNDFGQLDDKNYWQGRTIHMPNILDERIKGILIDHKNHMLDKFREYSGIDKIYIDTLHLVRWTEGYELFPHADAENRDGTRHEFYWRNFGTTTFLNDDFEGGELYFPNFNQTVIPKAGMTGIFPGNLEYLHGVKKITKGVRYNIASFLTYDKSKAYLI